MPTIDLHSLTAQELIDLVNFTFLGEVLTADKFRRQRSRAGFRIGDGKRYDMFKYVGWMFWRWNDVWTRTAGLSRDARHQADEASRLRTKRLSVRNLGPIPVIADIERRESCRRDLGRFILTYAGEGKHPFSRRCASRSSNSAASTNDATARCSRRRAGW